MPQLDIFSYFSSIVYLIILFLGIIYLLHNYYLPSLSELGKVRNKITSSRSALLNKEQVFLFTRIPFITVFLTNSLSKGVHILLHKNNKQFAIN